MTSDMVTGTLESALHTACAATKGVFLRCPKVDVIKKVKSGKISSGKIDKTFDE